MKTENSNILNIAIATHAEPGVIESAAPIQTDRQTILRGEDLPNDTVSLLKLHQQITREIELAESAFENAVGKPARAQAFQNLSDLQERAKPIGKKYVASQQGLPVIEITPVHELDRDLNRISGKDSRLEKVLPIANPKAEQKAISPDDYAVNSVNRFLAADDKMQANDRYWRYVRARYEVAYNEHAGLVNIRETLRELKIKMGQTKDLSELRKLNEQAIHLQSSHAREIASVARGLLLSAFEPVRFAEEMIFARAEAILVNLVKDAKQAEQFFFAGFGLPHEATSLSRKFENALKEVQTSHVNFNHSVASPATMSLPSPTTHPLHWLGIQDYAD